jgi:hypothetical protein
MHLSIARKYSSIWYEARLLDGHDDVGAVPHCAMLSASSGSYYKNHTLFRL